MTENTTYIYGKHVIMEALETCPEAILKLFLAEGIRDAALDELVKKSGVRVLPLLPKKMPGGVDATLVHQGAVAFISLPKIIKPYKEFSEGLTVGPDTALVLLGEIQDPQNVGAIIRSAAAFGMAGVLIPEHNQAQISGTIIKVSAGMAFRVPLVAISNVNTTIRDLKERGFWIYGLDEAGKQNISGESFTAPTVFILGNESKGVRQKTLELCDVLLNIKTNPRCESLNVASSAAIALYVWSTRHTSAVKG